jgi:hypothetical protein
MLSDIGCYLTLLLLVAFLALVALRYQELLGRKWIIRLAVSLTCLTVAIYMLFTGTSWFMNHVRFNRTLARGSSYKVTYIDKGDYCTRINLDDGTARVVFTFMNENNHYLKSIRVGDSIDQGAFRRLKHLN